MLFGVRREKWSRGFLVVIGIMIVSLMIFGMWIIPLMQQPSPFVQGAHNLWSGLWPFQVPLGMAILLYGINKKDNRFLVSSSPFLFPYATMGSLLGPWLAALSVLEDWQSLIILLSWWGAVIYRVVI
jgi:hypothetical protein